ncbi:uncharacterized protein LOC111115681 [Crassostrea virginica]
MNIYKKMDHWKKMNGYTIFTGIWHIDALFDGFGIVWGKTTERSCHLVLSIRLELLFLLSNTVVSSIHHEIQRYGVQQVLSLGHAHRSLLLEQGSSAQQPRDSSWTLDGTKLKKLI